MKWNRRFLIFGAVVFIISLSTWIFFLSSGPMEPVQGGRRLSEWISDLSSAVLLSEQTRHAEDAIKQIGTNALPVILDELRVEDDSAFMRTVHDKYKHSPLARKGSPIRLPHREAPDRRMQAAHALRVLAQPLGLSTLTNLMSDPNSHVQEAAAEALVSGFTIEGVEALMDALASENVQIRLAALHGLPGAGYIPQKIAPLIQCLEDPNPEVRERATLCLRHFSPVYSNLKIPGLIEGLVHALDDPIGKIRAQAAHTLGGLKPEAQTAILRLEKAVSDEDPTVRVAATQALAMIRASIGSEGASEK